MSSASFGVDALELWELELPFRMAFVHAAARRVSSHALVVVARSGAHRGYGEIIPRSYLTGETLETCRADLCDRWWPKLRALRFGKDAPFDTLQPLYDEADAARKTASYAGLDVAVFDLWARVNGVSGARMFGAAPASCPLTGVIGIGTAPGLLARAYRLLGCRDYKLKVGETAGTREGPRSQAATERDARAILAVRKAIGPDAPLVLDANAAYSERDATALLTRWADLGINACEEPLAYPDPIALAGLARATGLEVIADESLCTTADAARHIAAKSAAIWNLRLAKVGGFSGVRRLASLAKANDVRLVLGSLVGESSILASAARAALALAPFERAEAAASGWLLRRDPFRGPRGAPRGATLGPLSDAPGLGVEPAAWTLKVASKILISKT